VAYFVSSSALLVLNKIAITVIPNASVLLLIQVSSTVVITAAAGCGGVKSSVKICPSPEISRAYISVASVFLLTVYSNFKLVHAVGVNSFIVLRCSTPLLVSVLDAAFLGRELPRRGSVGALFGIAASGILYAWFKASSLDGGDILFSSRALIWSTVWLASFTLDMIYIKHIVHSFECSGLERTLYQNAFAIPLLVLTVLSPLESNPAYKAVAEATSRAKIALVLSCLAGTSLSFSGMTLRSELSATAFTVMGIMCKMMSSLLSELLVETEKTVWSLVSIFAAICFSAMYRQAPLRCTTAS